MVENEPYTQFVKNGYKYRIFDPNVDDDELKWHYDEGDRNIEVLISNKWRFQLDNQLPYIISTGDSIFIKTGEYHRIIKGSGCLIIRFRINGK